MAPLRFLVGSLAAGVPAGASVRKVDLGPTHPSRAGLVEIRAEVIAERLHSVEVITGAMHRGAEKLFEVRDYRQVLMLADRHDWQAPFFGELITALACEELLGLPAPERAQWLRTLLAEHTRAQGHLGFLTWPVRGDQSLVERIARLREELRVQLCALTGNRVHPMANRIGGLACDPTQAWLDAEHALLARVGDLGRELAEHEFKGAGVATLPTELIDGFGLSGPLVRSAGVASDLRLSKPLLRYERVNHLITPPADTAGDARARFRLWAQELVISAAIVAECCGQLPEGPIDVLLPKIVKLPEAETYLALEAPLGRAGVHLVSRGDKSPWRLKLRTPSFAHVAALETLLDGLPVEDLDCALASVGWVAGDLDK